MTPLLVAASAGHAQTVVAILRALPMDQRAKALAATDEAAGENALHLACVDGHAKCAKALLHEVSGMNCGSLLPTLFSNPFF